MGIHVTHITTYLKWAKEKTKASKVVFPNSAIYIYNRKLGGQQIDNRILPNFLDFICLAEFELNWTYSIE